MKQEIIELLNQIDDERCLCVIRGFLISLIKKLGLKERMI